MPAQAMTEIHDIAALGIETKGNTSASQQQVAMRQQQVAMSDTAALQATSHRNSRAYKLWWIHCDRLQTRGMLAKRILQLYSIRCE